jgi:hypothetical protein
MSKPAGAIATTLPLNAPYGSNWLTKLWAIAVLTLIAATWRLWLPDSDFPAIPVGPWPFGTSYLDVGSVVGIVIGLGCIVIDKNGKRTPFLLVILGFLIAFACNQHRLQPWAYQAVLHAIAIFALGHHAARGWIMVISIGIYFYSACGKFDFQFLHTVGQEFISPVLGTSEGPPSRLRLLLAAILPTTELFIAVGLCLPKTRWYAGTAAIGMHVALIVALGPWLLGHSLGVLLWNAWLSFMAWALFVAPYEPPPQVTPTPTRGWSAMAGKALLIFSLLLPLAERYGYWDHWLSWSLYSPHTSRVDIEVHRSAILSLPKASQRFIDDDEDGDGWHSLSIDKWSLATLGAPVYPQARFQLGVALAIAQDLPMKDTIRAKVRSVSDRWTGTRSERWLAGVHEIELAATDYWL